MRMDQVTISPIKAYLDAKTKIQNTTFIITNEGNFYEVNNKRISEQEFLSKNQIPFIEAGKGASRNYDRTKNFYMSGEKSY